MNVDKAIDLASAGGLKENPCAKEVAPVSQQLPEKSADFCACGFDRAACGKCGRGCAQCSAAAHPPASKTGKKAGCFEFFNNAKEDKSSSSKEATADGHQPTSVGAGASPAGSTEVISIG